MPQRLCAGRLKSIKFQAFPFNNKKGHTTKRGHGLFCYQQADLTFNYHYDGLVPGLFYFLNGVLCRLVALHLDPSVPWVGVTFVATSEAICRFALQLNDTGCFLILINRPLCSTTEQTNDTE